MKSDLSGKWIIAMTGASGVRYGARLIDIASQHLDELHVIISDSALRVFQEEDNRKISRASLNACSLFGREQSNVVFHNPKDIGASPASGSVVFDGMVVVPCSMNSLAAIANGLASNLIHRAADVTLKEGRKLIMVPRETPLSPIHLSNMLKLAELGVSITAAMPGFYLQPDSIDDLVDMVVMKILDQMGVSSQLCKRWKPMTEITQSVVNSPETLGENSESTVSDCDEGKWVV